MMPMLELANCGFLSETFLEENVQNYGNTVTTVLLVNPLINNWVKTIF